MFPLITALYVYNTAVIGRINGIICLAFANDATVKAGTMYPISVKKQMRSIEIALENKIPCVSVVDSGGAFLPLQVDVDWLSHTGLFFKGKSCENVKIPFQIFYSDEHIIPMLSFSQFTQSENF